MFGITVIEVAIGLVFAYLILSSVCSGLFELIATLTKLRARHLEDGLKVMLKDPNGTLLVQKLYQHHLISSGFESVTGKITNIAGKNFVQALIDILAPGTAGQGAAAVVAKIEESLTTGEYKDLPQEVKDKIMAVVKAGGNRMDKIRGNIEGWFNNSMDYLTVWYKQRARRIIFAMACIVVLGFNADTIRMARSFWNDDELRQGIVMASDAYIQKNLEDPVKFTMKNADSVNAGVNPVAIESDSLFKELRSSLENLETAVNEASVLPVGWGSEHVPSIKEHPKDFALWLLYKIVGLVFTIGAVSLGAPHWFSLLKQLLNLRSMLGGGQQQAPAKEESEEEEGGK